ncbi:MAG: HAMP domain-containing sensor histidine kinase [Cyanobacteria bacterium J06639_1]
MLDFSALTPEGDRRARKLYRQLLVSYLGVTTVVFGLSAISVYTFASYSLRQQLQAELLVLAETAAPSLDLATTQSEFFAANTDHWHALEQHSQSLEWYDASGELLVREGKVVPSLTLPAGETLNLDGIIQRDRDRQLYVAVLPVYEADELAGIVRASEAERIVEQPLQNLAAGLAIGGVLGLGAIAATGLGLSRLALEPFLQSYRRLRQFTADASHEIRSPLAIVQAANDAMSGRAASISEEQPAEERASESDRADMNRIRSASHQLQQLTEALLQLARTDENVAIDMQPLPLHELLEDLVGAFEQLARDRDIQLSHTQLDPVTVRGNSTQLVRLFTNLIQNGLKYTSPGGSVSVSLQRAGRTAIASVTDTGEGISAADLPHVFERFWQADRARSRQAGGLGLGLSIASDIARRHGGDIAVRSQVGRCSTFEVSLPAIAP